MAGSSEDTQHMQRCLELARRAAGRGEVPVGALVVIGERVLGAAHNRCEERGSPLAHAEMEALHQAFGVSDDARLPGAVFYCTLEPCFMCTGALLHARVARIVFGARDPKFGACGSLASLPTDRRLNHRCEVVGGVLEAESAALLRTFFRGLR